MDFLDPKKKLSNKRRLYLGYFLIAIAIGLGSFILLLIAYGYGFNRSGDVYKNGLVFLSSQPGDATAVITSKTRDFYEQKQTDARLEIQEGSYHVSLNKPGYREWQRDFQLEGGGIERMLYPLLFPENLQSTPVDSYTKKTTFISSSPDRRWIVLNEPSSIGSFQVFDANAAADEQKPRTFNLPGSVLTSSKAKQHLELVEWSTDNKHMLIKHVYGKRFEYVVINHVEPSKSFNVNQTFNGTFAKVLLHDKKVAQLYLLPKVGGLLELGNTETGASNPVASDVLAFHPYSKDMVLYVTSTKSKKIVQAKLRTKATDYTLRELPAGSKYLLDLAKFDGNWIVAVGSANEGHVYVYKNPLDWLQNPDTGNVFARTMSVDNPNAMSFSTSAQFLAVQSGQTFSVYDVFADRQYNYAIDNKFQGDIAWMDSHRLAGVSNNQVIVFDFDGVNVQKLTNALPGTQPLFNRNYEILYSFAPSTAKGYALNRTSLVVE